MTRITVDVEDDHVQELMQYLNSLSYVKITEGEIPNWHKEELDAIAQNVEDGEMPTYDLKESINRIFDRKSK